MESCKLEKVEYDEKTGRIKLILVGDCAERKKELNEAPTKTRAKNYLNRRLVFEP